MNNPLQTLVSQYANSPRIVALVSDWNIDIDPSADVDRFYDDLWNIDTAVGWGLDVWGRIVGVTRNVRLRSGGPWFGFAGQTEAEPFNQGVFYGSGSSGSTVYPLSDSDFRLLIMVKALANISLCTAGNMSALLRKLFSVSNPTGNCYVLDNGDMSITLVFDFLLTYTQYAILTQTGVFVKPAGVSYSINYI